MNQPEVFSITDKEDKNLPIAIRLFSSYLNELGEALGFQQVDKELNNPLLKYGPPQGALLLAFVNGEPAGCVALQLLTEEGVCEMKRLYVLPAYRHLKLGRLLANAIMQQARQMGYVQMKLDTLERLQAAIGLYHSLGFTETTAYYHNPLDGVVYMQKDL